MDKNKLQSLLGSYDNDKSVVGLMWFQENDANPYALVNLVSLNSVLGKGF